MLFGGLTLLMEVMGALFLTAISVYLNLKLNSFKGIAIEK